MADKPATVKAWAVINRYGFIPSGWVRRTRSEAIEAATDELAKSWQVLRKDFEYRVARVTITEDRR